MIGVIITVVTFTVVAAFVAYLAILLFKESREWLGSPSDFVCGSILLILSVMLLVMNVALIGSSHAG